MSTRTKAQASVTYYDSANFTSAIRTAIVNWVNKEAAAVNAGTTGYPRKYSAKYTSGPAKSTVLQAQVDLTDAAKWDATTKTAVVAWLQAIATQLTNDATPKAFKRTQVFTFGR